MKNTIKIRYRIMDGSGITRKYTAELRRMAQLLQVSLGKGSRTSNGQGA